MIGQQSCRCCGEGKLKPRMLASLRLLEKRTGVPFLINSGCRCDEWNKKSGGHKRSHHKIVNGFGNAVDGWMLLLTIRDLYYAALEIPNFSHGQIGLYFTETGWFIHLADCGYKHRFAYNYCATLGKMVEIDFDDALRMLESQELSYV